MSDVLDDGLHALGVVRGTEIVAVDGEPVHAYARREVAPYQSASTSQDLDVRTYSYAFLAGPRGKSPKVTFRNADGKDVGLAVQRHGIEGMMKVLAPRVPFEFRMLPDGVAYVALNSFNNDEAADKFLVAFDQIANAKGLVIDLRQNGGGNSNVGFRVLATLTGKPFQTGKWETRNYLPPGVRGASRCRTWPRPTTTGRRTWHTSTASRWWCSLRPRPTRRRRTLPSRSMR